MKVYLVGGGPGDPELITVKGMRLLESAEVVVYDSLISPELLDYARHDAERIHVGKRAGRHSKAQEDINELLISKAREGKTVVRLKGGDPFVFGRGGEEASALFHAGVPFEVVPGITAAIGIGAYTGIPLTDRRHASQVLFISACHADLKPDHHDWSMLANFDGTIVIYMGARHLDFLADQLLEHGMAGNTPVSTVQSGTTKLQKTVTATLNTIAVEAKLEKIAAPALIIIGQVNSLRDQLDWFEYAQRVEETSGDTLA